MKKLATRPELVKTMADIKAELEADVIVYNELLQSGKGEEAAAKNEHQQELVKEYNIASRDLVFANAFEKAGEENDTTAVMIAAVTALTYPTIRLSDKKDEDSVIPVREITGDRKRLPLAKMPDYGKVGADEKWLGAAEKFNVEMIARALKDLVDESVDLPTYLKSINKTLKMSKIAQEFELGENPVSNTKLLDTLRTVVKMMIGEEYAAKVITRDVRMIEYRYISEDKKDRTGFTNKVCTKKDFVDLLLIVCHHAITGKPYEVICKDFKDPKEKK